MNSTVKIRSAALVVGAGLAATIALVVVPQKNSRINLVPASASTSMASSPLAGGAGASNPHSGVAMPSYQEPRPPRSAENDEWMAGIREAGLHGDRSRIPEMIAALQRPKHPDMIKTALNGLSHLGAVEALPAIDALIRNERADPDNRNYAIAARARLVAENSAASVSDPASRAAAKISRLQRETGLSASRMNQAAQNHRANGGHSYYPEQPMEVYVMRDLADIAYREHYSSANGVPGAEGVDFSQDAASALKVKLALLPQSQRAAWLVQDLAHNKGRSETASFEEQLAVDEGLPASRAAGLELQEMDKHRDRYPFSGFADLSMILMGIGDKSQLPLLEHLSRDPDPRIAEGWGLVYSRVLHGKRTVLDHGY